MSEKTLSNLQVFSALGIVVVFAGFAGYVVFVASSGTDDTVWSRILVVFSSFESLGFAAAGLLLGQQVNTTTARRLVDVEKRNDMLAQELAETERQKTKVVEGTLPTLRTIRNELASRRGLDPNATEMAIASDQSKRDIAIRLLDDLIAATEASRQEPPRLGGR